MNRPGVARIRLPAARSMGRPTARARPDNGSIILVFNNRMYGNIRMHQELRHPGRVIATDLTSPDFQGFARALGAHAERVTSTDEFLPAFERARASGRAAVIELEADPDLISTRFTLTSLEARRATK